MRAALIDANGLVVNVILIGENYTPPDGLTVGPSGGEIGDTWNGVSYVRPVIETPEPQPPKSVSPYQARCALHAAGLLPAVEATIANADVPAQIAWEYATVFERHSPFIDALAPMLGLTEEQIDDLFLAASQV